jgi:hypothetical protein
VLEKLAIWCLEVVSLKVETLWHHLLFVVATYSPTFPSLANGSHHAQISTWVETGDQTVSAVATVVVTKVFECGAWFDVLLVDAAPLIECEARFDVLLVDAAPLIECEAQLKALLVDAAPLIECEAQLKVLLVGAAPPIECEARLEVLLADTALAIETKDQHVGAAPTIATRDHHVGAAIECEAQLKVLLVDTSPPIECAAQRKFPLAGAAPLIECEAQRKVLLADAAPPIECEAQHVEGLDEIMDQQPGKALSTLTIKTKDQHVGAAIECAVQLEFPLADAAPLIECEAQLKALLVGAARTPSVGKLGPRASPRRASRLMADGRQTRTTRGA